MTTTSLAWLLENTCILYSSNVSSKVIFFFSFTDFSSGKLWSCVSVFVLGPILSRSLHLLHHCMKLCNQGYIYYMEQNQTELLHHYLDVINYINICYIFIWPFQGLWGISTIRQRLRRTSPFPAPNVNLYLCTL